MMPKSVLLLALVATGALSVPIDVLRFDDDTSCASTCTGSGKFRYEPGKTYEFTYETQTKTGIEGASEDKSTIIMLATANVEVMSQCEFVLRMDDVRLMEIDPETPSRQIYSPSTRDFQRELEANPLRFGFHDGRIVSVCPNGEEPAWILNIKRGVLSTFQNAMASLDKDQILTETDVAGDCDAEYKVINPESRWSQVITVKKVKNLLGCTRRHGYNSAIQAMPYHVQSEIQSLPLMHSKHECEQKIDGGVLISSSCQEVHMFRPFSKGSNGAVTETTQKLKFKQEKSDVRTRPAFIDRRSDMRFEHSPVEGADSASLRSEAEKKLEVLCSVTEEDIRPETPQLFADLVNTMRQLDRQSLVDIFRRVRSSRFCPRNEKRTRKFFMDAVPMIGTQASVGLIEDLVSKGLVDGIEQDVWITSLAFIPNPTREILSEAKPLLRKKPTGNVLLSISALVNNYCRKTSCGSDMEVEDIVTILTEKLGDNCDIRGQDAESILYSLRAIGNTGHAQKAVPTLNRCFAKEDLPMEIRLSAVNAFRHISCKADRNNIMALFKNKEEDSELRIAAYLSAMECPTTWVLEQVKEALESEAVNQVGSFVWSHLTNLMETSDPHKQEIRAILEDETLVKEFDMDRRKFSRNYETSLFLKKFNTGAKGEANLIWSSKSFLPRSAMVNLTVDLFGHAVNLIEIGGRVEGLEYYLEGLFGPEGAMKDTEGKQAWRRAKRAVRKDKMDRIKQRYGISSDEFAGSMYFRMFGNELGYLSLGGPASERKSSPNIMEMLLKLAKQNSYQVTQNIMFMDSSIVIPTAIGLPLKLTVNGTAALDLKVSGKADVKKATSRPANMLIEGLVQPSGAVQVVSSMVVDAYVLRSGLRMVSTLHSSTASSGKIEVSNGEILNVEFGTPREKMEVINMETKFFVLHRESEREQRMIEDDRREKEICSGDRLAKITGLEICGSIGFTNASSRDEAPYFPLTGPLRMGINIMKRDSHSAYVLSAKYSDEGSKNIARVSFDTPGSRVNRRLVADVELDHKNKDFKAELVSPWKQASLKGSLINRSDLKRAIVRVTIDRQREYVAESEIKISETGQRVKYIPLIEISAPGMKRMTMGGSIEKKGSKAIEVDLSSQNVLSKPVNIRSTIVMAGEQKSISGSIARGKEIYRGEAKILSELNRKRVFYNASIHMQCPKGELIRSHVSFENAQDAVKSHIVLDTMYNDPIMIAGSLETKGRRDWDKRNLTLAVVTPMIKLDVNGDVNVQKTGKRMITTKLNFGYELPKKSRVQAMLSSKMRNLSTKSLSKFDATLNADFKDLPMYNFDANGNLELSSSQLNTKLEVQYGDNPKDEDKKITFVQIATNNVTRYERDCAIKIGFKYPAENVDVQLKGNHLMNRNKIDSNVKISYGKSKEINANLKAVNLMKRKNKASLDAGISYPGQRFKLTSDVVKASDTQYNNKIILIWGKKGKAKIVSTFQNPSDLSHSIESNIRVTGRPPVTVSGSINRDPTDFSASSGISIGKREHQIAVKGQKLEKLVIANIDLKVPSRRLSADLKGDWRDKYISHADLKWDADNDESKRIVLDTNYKDENDWSRRNIAGTLRLTSPFQYAKLISLDLGHSVDSLQYESSAKIGWSPSDKISGTLTLKRPIGLKRLDASLDAKTSFRAMPNIKAEISHRVENGIATSIKAEAGRHNIDIDLSGSKQGWSPRSEIIGNVVVKSSIPDYERVSLAGRHSCDGREYNSEITAEMGNQGVYTGNLEYSITGRTFLSGNRGKIILKTPIRNYQKIETDWSHRLLENAITSSISASCGRDKLAFSIDASHRSSYHQRMLSANIEVQSPLRPFRDVKLVISHDHRPERLDSSASFVRNRNKRTEYSVFYSYDPDWNVESKAMFVCPGTHAASVKLNTRLSQSPHTADLEVEWSPTDKMTLTGELTLDDLRKINSVVTMTTPFRRLERIVLSGHHTYEDGIFVNGASLEYAPRREIEIRTKFSKEASILGEIEITAPFYEFQKFKLGVEHSGELSRAINSRAEFELKPQVGLIELIGSLRNGRERTANLRLNTPYRQLPYSEARITARTGSIQAEVEYLPNQIVKADVDYRLDDPRDLFTEVTVTTPISSFDYLKTSFLHRGTFRRSRSVVKVEYPRREEFSATVNFENDEKIDVSVDLKAPDFDDVRMNVRHSGSSRDFSSHAEVSYMRYKKIEGDVIFSLKRGGKGPIMSIESAAKSPYSKDFNLQLTHEGNIVDFKSNLETSYGHANKLTYNVGFDSSSENIHLVSDLNVESDVIKPIRSSATLNLKGELRDFKGNFEGSYNNKVIESTVSSKVRQSRIESSVTLNTPFEIARSIEASLNHREGQDNINSDIKLEYNNNNYEGVLAYTKNKLGIDGSVNVKTPIPDYENLSGTVRFNGDLKKMEGSSKVMYARGKEIELTGDVDLLSERKRFEVIAHTPFDDYETISASGNISGKLSNMDLNGHIQYNSRSRLGLKSKIDLEGRKKVIEVSLSTPFIDYERLSVAMNLAGEPMQFTSEASVDYKRGKTIETNVNVDLLDRQKEFAVIVKTPFENFRETSLLGKFDGDSSKFDGYVHTSYLDGQQIILSSSADLESNPKSLSANLRTPFKVAREIAVVANFNGYARRFKADSQVTYNQRNGIEISANVDLEGRRRTISGLVKTPIDGFKHISVTGDYSDRSPRHQGELIIEYALDKKVEIDGILDLESKRKLVQGSIKSPFEGYEDLSTKIRFQGIPTSFSGDAELQYARNKKFELEGSLDIDSSPKSIQVSAKSPIREWRDQSVSASISGELRRSEIEARATYDDQKTVTFNGAVDILGATKIVSGRITTPYPGMENQAISLSLEGSPKEFETSLNIESSKLRKPIVARSSFDYKSPTNLDLTASFSSDIPNAESLRLVIKNSNDRRISSEIEAMWAPRRIVSFNGNFDYVDAWRGTRINADAQLSTPFESLRKISANVEQSWKNDDTYEGKVRLDTPARKVQLEISRSDSDEKKALELIGSWDVDRDDSKKIILSSAIEKSDSSVKTDVKVELPSIRQEIQFVGEASLNKGRTLFDGKAELSYSSDRRKKLAVSARVDDEASGYSDHSNISVVMGISHPYTSTDIRIVSHAGKSPSRLSMAAEIDMLNSRRQRENLRLRGEIDRIRKEARLEIASPVKTIEMTGRVRDDDGYHISLHNDYGRSRSIDTNIVLSDDQLTLSMGTDPENPRNTINLQAGYKGDKVFAIEAFHMSRSGRVSDGLVSFTLNNSRILHTRLHWRPSVIREIKEEAQRRARIYHASIMTAARDSPDMIRELVLKSEAIGESLKRDLAPIVDLAAQASRSLDMQIAEILEELDRQGLRDAVRSMQDLLRDAMRFADDSGSRILEFSYQIKNSAKDLIRLDELTKYLADVSEEYYQEGRKVAYDSLRNLMDRIEKLAKKASEEYKDLEEKAKDVLKKVYERVREAADRLAVHPLVIKAQGKTNLLMKHIKEIAKPESFAKINKKVQSTLKSYSLSVGDSYTHLLKTANDKVSEIAKTLAKRQEIQHAVKAANEVYQQGKWAYKYWEVEERAVDALKALLRTIKDLLLEEAEEVKDRILNLHDSRVIVYDPRNGEIQFEIALPIVLKSLRSMPDESIHHYLKTYKKYANAYIPSRNFSITDTYYSWKPSTDIADWIPPFRARASVSGKQHFTTFDGRHFEFAGLCSYVLAQDFMDGNFSVILNYEGDWTAVSKKSLTIVTDNKRVDIMPDYRVEVDSRPQELPYQYESMSVIRRGPIITVDSGNGLEVELDLAHDIYTVTLSGWFYGKTAGLLGTYDNEPSNDMVMSTMGRADSIAEFAHSWEVARSCRSRRNFAKTISMEEDAPGYKTCAKYFMSEKSPFANCFRQVPIEGAMARCMIDYMMQPSESAICNATAQYIRQCKDKGVPLDMPSMCVSCMTTRGGIFTHGRDIYLSENGMSPPMSADVVFVVEERECNKEVAPELESLVKSIQQFMSVRKLRDNQFGLVGYGGVGPSGEVYSHTINGKLLESSKRFGLAVESLSFKRKAGISDVLEAVHFASQYPFRAGVSKSIVLMPCSSCVERATSYQLVKEILEKRGITLHLLKKQDFEFGSNRSPKSTKIFGIDNDGAYAYGNKNRQMKGDLDLLNKLRVPSDNCIALTQTTNGTLFNMERLINGRQVLQTSSRKTWTSKIAESSEVMSCQKCQCMPDSNGVGTSVCSRCDGSSLRDYTQSILSKSSFETRPLVTLPDPEDDSFSSQLVSYLNLY